MPKEFHFKSDYINQNKFKSLIASHKENKIGKQSKILLKSKIFKN